MLIASLFGSQFNPNRPLEPLRFCLIVEHIVCLILEGVAGYVKRIRQAICRQASKRWAGSNGNNLKDLIRGLVADWGSSYLFVLTCVYHS